MVNTEKTNSSKRDLHKRLSQMEFEINELNDILTENIDSSKKKRLASNGSRVASDDLHSLEESILNDKIDFSLNGNDEIKPESPIDNNKSPTSPTNLSKANSDWVVYTNQEGRRIHEITVKQKILEIEKNPVFESESGNESESPKTTTPKTDTAKTDTPKTLSVPFNVVVSPKKKKSLENIPRVIVGKKEEVKTVKLNNNNNNNDATKMFKPQKDSIYNNQPKKNPFRVVSVKTSDTLKYEKEGKSDSTAQGTNNDNNDERVAFIARSPSPEPINSPPEDVEEIRKTFEEIEIPSDMNIMLSLHDHLCKKINKLITEIEYVDKIVNNHYSYSLTFDELNQFKNGNKILKNYLDKKYKQKYELELRLSSKFRKLKNEDKMNASLFFSNR
ncbi:hypothetical protein ACO0SA_001400 [Hanseniaspora valbyensis]